MSTTDTHHTTDTEPALPAVSIVLGQSWKLYAKLGVSDRAAAVGEAFDRGLLVPRGQGGGT